jgi:hypothetical protein
LTGGITAAFLAANWCRYSKSNAGSKWQPSQANRFDRFNLRNLNRFQSL